MKQINPGVLAGILLVGTMVPAADAQFIVTYYDNYNNVTQEWDYWESGSIQRFWNDEYLADFTSGNTEPSAHYLPSIDVLDLRTGFGSLDTHYEYIVFDHDDWTPLKSIGDPAWYGAASPHHVYAARFEGVIYLEAGDVLSLESDDDAYIFLDESTAWGEEILSDPGMHPFEAPYPSLTIPPELAGFHKMTVKFADRHEVQAGIRITINGAPLQAVLSAMVRIEPETLNLDREGVFTAFVRLTGDHSVAGIDVSTVECARAAAIKATRANDTLVVKFNRQDLEGVTPGPEVTLTVTGTLANGRWFVGSDTINVVDPGAGKK